MGLAEATALGLGAMMASAVFTLSGVVVQEVGGGSLIAFFLSSLFALTSAIAYTSLVKRFPVSGGSYRYACELFPPIVAYFVGIVLALAFGSLCAVCLSAFSSYWETPLPFLGLPIGGAIALAVLLFINLQGTRLATRLQIALTASVAILLVALIADCALEVDLSELSRSVKGWRQGQLWDSVGLLFVVFFGFSAIVATAGEVDNPARTVPRSLGLALGCIVVLFAGVVAILLGADLTLYRENSLLEAAVSLAGPWATNAVLVALVVSIFSTVNAGIVTLSRVLFCMSQRGHLPAAFSRVNRRRGVPSLAVLSAGLLIAALLLWLPFDVLVRTTASLFLINLTIVHVALTVASRDHLGSRFELALGIFGAMIHLLFLIQVMSSSVGLLLISIGMVSVIGLLVLKAWEPAEAGLEGEASRIAFFTSPEPSKKDFRILLPVANPETSSYLTEVACAIAKERGGEVLFLRVVRPPDQLPPDQCRALVRAQERGLQVCFEQSERDGVSSVSLIRFGRSIPKAILETSTEQNCDLILLGWAGQSGTTDQLLGRSIEMVLSRAKSDVILVKLIGDGRRPRRFLLPTAGGLHASKALEYTMSLARWAKSGTVTVCGVAENSAKLESAQERAAKCAEEIGIRDVTVNAIGKVGSSVSTALATAVEDYDALVIGATGRSFWSQLVMGSIPAEVAKLSRKPVFVVKSYKPVGAVLRRVME